MNTIISFLLIINSLNSDCLDSEALKGMGFTQTKSNPEILDQDVCSEQIKQHGSCVDVDELKSLMEKQQQDLVDGLGVDDEIDNVLVSYQEGLEGTNLEEEFVQVRENYKENKSKCGNKLAKVNQGVLCLVASGQASQYAQVSGTEITVDVNSSEIEESNQSCEPVVEAICLAGTGQSIEKDIVADDAELTGDNQDLQDTCNNIKNNKNNLVENFNTQKIKKVMPNKEEIEKINEKVTEKKDTIKEKIKDKKGGEKIAKTKTDSEQSDDFQKDIEQQEKQKDGDKPEGDKETEQQKPKSDTQDKSESDTQDKPKSDTQQKPSSDMQNKSQSDTQQNATKPSESDNTQKPPAKNYRRLQSTYNLNIRQTSNGAPVVTIATTSGVEDAFDSSHILYVMFLSITIFIQIN